MRSKPFHNYEINNNRDDDVPNGRRQIVSVLKLYLAIPLMICTNRGIKKGRVKGTL